MKTTMWSHCLGGGGQERAFRVMSAFWRIMQNAAIAHNADVILLDLGPNLGAINWAALISADYVVVPLSLDCLYPNGLSRRCIRSAVESCYFCSR